MSDSAPKRICFHCRIAIRGDTVVEKIEGNTLEFCSDRCHETCLSIFASGHGRFYEVRDSASPDPDAARPGEENIDPDIYDHPAIQNTFVRRVDDRCEASFVLEGIRCGACAWLIEKTLRSLDGVASADVDYASHRARVRWQPDTVKLSRILDSVSRIGYRAVPFDASHREQLMHEQKRRSLERIIFAAVLGMVVMHYSLATYVLGVSVEPETMPRWVDIGRWTSAVLALAILVYPGQDFFSGAWRDIRNHRLGMDVPIVLGLSIAFLGSLYATMEKSGHVYFDSIAMFVLFLLISRAWELKGRRRAATAMDKLMRIIPRFARVIGDDGAEVLVPVVDIKPGQKVRVHAGETVPADGMIRDGTSAFDESLLTGEARPVRRTKGDNVVGGAINLNQPVTIKVIRLNEESTLAQIRMLLERGLSKRPRYAELAQKAAGWFVTVILLLAIATFCFWIWRDPPSAIPVTVSLLIVTCPCALAIATPVALAVASGRLVGLGVLPLRMKALEPLATATRFAFDKTGTLTSRVISIARVWTADDVSRDVMLATAAALERHSTHPVGQAFASYDTPGLPATDIVEAPGAGVEGRVAGHHWRLGRSRFAATGDEPTNPSAGFVRELEAEGERALVLSREGETQAVFGLGETLRSGALGLAASLLSEGADHLTLLSGDADLATQRVGQKLGLDEIHGGMTPADKLGWIQQQQEAGHQVVMVGDGINDAPTLAAADVSLSFADAPELAQTHSDFILLVDDLDAVVAARKLARTTRRVILQNLLWAAGYNLVTIPLAILGLIPPWLAAIGMSLSSLIVVGNAQRLRHVDSDEHRPGFKEAAAVPGT